MFSNHKPQLGRKKLGRLYLYTYSSNLSFTSITFYSSLSASFERRSHAASLRSLLPVSALLFHFRHSVEREQPPDDAAQRLHLRRERTHQNGD